MQQNSRTFGLLYKVLAITGGVIILFVLYVLLLNAPLWCLVVVLGIETGASLTGIQIIVPSVLAPSPASEALAEASRQAVRSERRISYVATAIAAVVALVNLAAAIDSTEQQRGWWVFAASISLFIGTVNTAYFTPVMLQLKNAGGVRVDEVKSKAHRWQTLNRFRVLTLALGWLSALKAFSSAA